MPSLVFVQGFFTSAALIIAIGAQNAFVLRQGLKREHVLSVVLVCALSDVLLIGIGIAGLGTLVQREPLLLGVARWGGAAFLAAYGAFAARRALADHRLAAAGPGTPVSRRAAVLACLGFTYLNPHCWLDTVVLVGSLSAQHGESRWVFGAGAALASGVWFTALGYGARLLGPLFARPLAWRVLDGGIAAVMWSLALTLVLRAPA